MGKRQGLAFAEKKLTLAMRVVLPSCRCAQVCWEPALTSIFQNEDPEAGDADDRWPALREILTPEILAMTGTFPMTLFSQNTPPKTHFEALYWVRPHASSHVVSC
jgi:hypothetical protein